MSKQYLKEIFSHLTECHAWSLQVVQVKNSSRNGISYICREVEIEPNDRLLQYITNTASYYNSDKGIDSFSSVDDYTGNVVDHVIYKLKKDNKLINHEFGVLIQAIGQSDTEIKLSDIRPNAAVFRGTVTIDRVDVPVLLISMQKPISALSNKFMLIATNKFHEIDAPVLTLRKTIDVAIIGDTVYLFTLAGETLFNMERTYKAVCKSLVDEIVKCDFLTDAESFSNIASSGRNPRRFVAYNSDHFDWLSDKENRKTAAAKFGFKLEGDDIDTADADSTEKLVKFLCNKAMVDPCDASPVEVANTKPWS